MGRRPLAHPPPNDTTTTAAFPRTTLSPSTFPFPLSHVNDSDTEHPSPLSNQCHGTEASLPINHAPLGPALLGQLPTGKELEDLVQLYFSSVHREYLHAVVSHIRKQKLTVQPSDFGYFAFIHQLHFNRLLAKGKAPRELTLMMIASAMRQVPPLFRILCRIFADHPSAGLRPRPLQRTWREQMLGRTPRLGPFSRAFTKGLGQSSSWYVTTRLHKLFICGSRG